MADEWMETTIGSLLASDGGSVKTGPFGTTLKAKEYSTEGVPLISVGEVGYGYLRVSDKTPRAPREVVERLPEYLLETGDIVFGRKGAVDRSALVQPTQSGWFLGSDGIRLRLPKTCDARFIAYQLQSRDIRAWLVQHATGTTMASLNQAIIERVTISLPPIGEQRAIARILGTLDDKIELNRRMNETLEAMARALFKSWFVDFLPVRANMEARNRKARTQTGDPVRAKAKGRDPLPAPQSEAARQAGGLPKSLAGLFPDSFEDSALGEIPKGWGVGTLSDVASLNPESWSKETRPVVINYIDLSNVKWGSIDDVVGYTQQDAPSRAQRVLRSGDTIVGTVRPGNGSYAFINEDGLTGSTGFAVLRPHRSEYAQFIYLAATAAENIDALAHLADGGAYPAVRSDVVIATPVIQPRDKVLARFSIFSDSLLARIAQNEHESRTLAALRDTLLPKLISGELRINVGGPYVEEATR